MVRGRGPQRSEIHPPMITFSLQSGSNGNSIYVEAGDTRLLFDAGITGALAEKSLAEYGRDIVSVVAGHDLLPRLEQHFVTALKVIADVIINLVFARDVAGRNGQNTLPGAVIQYVEYRCGIDRIVDKIHAVVAESRPQRSIEETVPRIGGDVSSLHLGGQYRCRS